jgi:Flp pilus assembly protein TadG
MTDFPAKCYQELRAALSSIQAHFGERTRSNCHQLLRCECGAALVEFGFSAAVYFSVFFGVIQMSIGLYTYCFVCEAAREASRYAAVRGSNSCGISSTFPNCNLLPTTSGNPLKTYVQGLGYPGAQSANLTVTATWWEPTTNGSGQKSWTTACTGATDGSGNACNLVGNMVKVVVTDNYLLEIPFVPRITLPVSSESEMMIDE